MIYWCYKRMVLTLEMTRFDPSHGPERDSVHFVLGDMPLLNHIFALSGHLLVRLALKCPKNHVLILTLYSFPHHL